MARITVEDCIDKVPNKFELIVLAARRSRELSTGSKALISRDSDKDTVVSLREIAVSALSVSELRARLVDSLSKPVVEIESEVKDMILLQDLAGVTITEEPDEDEDAA